MVNISGWNCQKILWHYPDIEPSRQPFPHCSCVPVLLVTSISDLDEDNDTVNLAEAVDEDSDNRSNTALVKLFIQGEQKERSERSCFVKRGRLDFGIPSQRVSCS